MILDGFLAAVVLAPEKADPDLVQELAAVLQAALAGSVVVVRRQSGVHGGVLAEAVAVPRLEARAGLPLLQAAPRRRWALLPRDLRPHGRWLRQARMSASGLPTSRPLSASWVFFFHVRSPGWVMSEPMDQWFPLLYWDSCVAGDRSQVLAFSDPMKRPEAAWS
jgi:hypothetical protein